MIGAKGSSSTTTPKISITASYEGLEGNNGERVQRRY